MTTNVSNFPSIQALDRPDGSIEVKVLGVSHIYDGDSARGEALRHIHAIAADAELNRPVRARTSTVDGAEVVLIVEPEGTYYVEGEPETRHPVPLPAPVDVAIDQDVHEQADKQTAAPASPPAAAPPSSPSVAPASTEPTSSAQIIAGPGVPRHHQRKSFIADGPVIEPARQGWRGALNRMGMRLDPGPAEREWRDDVTLVSQHWPGPRTISIGNPKGSANKTPTTAMLSAIFARYGGAGVLAWDNNETRGSLAWRTQRANHESTVLDLLPRVSDLLSTSAQSAEMSYFAHHQPKDKYDVLRSDQSTEGDHEVSAADVDAIHRVAGRYYRMIVMDSGNNERAANWRAMIERANVLVVPCTNVEDTAEAGARMLEALAARDEHSRALAENAVVIVSKRSPAKDQNIPRIVEGFQGLVREVVTIPYDKALVSGVIHFDSMRPATQRAWLRAAAAVARGL